jgi:hypothetical protein
MRRRIIRIFRIRNDANAVIAKRAAQKGLQFLQLGLIQARALVCRLFSFLCHEPRRRARAHEKPDGESRRVF